MIKPKSRINAITLASSFSSPSSFAATKPVNITPGIPSENPRKLMLPIAKPLAATRLTTKTVSATDCEGNISNGMSAKITLLMPIATRLNSPKSECPMPNYPHPSPQGGRIWNFPLALYSGRGLG